MTQEPETVASATGPILFVDDEPAIRRLYLTYLKSEGFDIEGAGSIAEATAALSKRDYGLVIADKNLPDGSGLDLLRICREKYPDLEVIMLTGYPSLESVIEALRYGAFDYLIKPIRDLELLFVKSKRALERRKLRIENRSLARDSQTAGGRPLDADQTRKIKNHLSRMRQQLSLARERIIAGQPDDGAALIETCLILAEDIETLLYEHAE